MIPIVCIDAGHGGHDPGALGPHMLEEKAVALSVALMLRDLLLPSCRVIMTRTNDFFVSLSERAAFANRENATLFLSIHCNSGPPGLGAGYEVWTSPGQTGSDPFATKLFEAFEAQFPTVPGRTMMEDGDPDKESNFAVLRLTRMPAALFELEFIHTERGEGILRSIDNQRLMASALAKGVLAHLFPEQALPTPPPSPAPAPAVPLKDQAFAIFDRMSLRIDQAREQARQELEALLK